MIYAAPALEMGFRRSVVSARREDPMDDKARIRTAIDRLFKVEGDEEGKEQSLQQEVQNILRDASALTDKVTAGHKRDR